MKAARILASAVALTVATAAPAAPPRFELSSHQADYRMTLSYARLSGGVTGASGSMTYRFQDTCDGWAVENQTDLDFSYGADPPVATTWRFVTWESKDGLRYRYQVRSTRDGEVDQMIDGTARLDGKNGPGSARFTQPEGKTLKLPRGTVFPTAHTLALIDAAERGERLVNRVLFDGSDAGGAFEAAAFIGRERPANAPLAPALSRPDVAAELLSAPSWPMEIAFYPLAGHQSAPDYQVGLRYYQNGVADTVLQAFDDFTVAGMLTRLRPVSKPSC